MVSPFPRGTLAARATSSATTPSPACGKYASNVLPLPGELSTFRAPPCCVTIPCTVDRPSPVPCPTALVVKKGSRIRSNVAASGVVHGESNITAGGQTSVRQRKRILGFHGMEGHVERTVVFYSMGPI